MCCHACAVGPFGDPIAAAASRLSGLGDLTGTQGAPMTSCFAWPSDVDHAKERIDPSFISTNEALRACKGVTDAERAGWDKFYASWRTFRERKTPMFGAANECETTNAYARDLAAWQATFARKCDVPGPTPGGEAPGVDLSWVKWAAAATIVGVVGYVVVKVIP